MRATHYVRFLDIKYLLFDGKYFNFKRTGMTGLDKIL